MPRITRRQTMLGAAAAALAGQARAATTHEVEIKGFAFSPAGLNVRAGDTVRWTNRDSAPHTATAANGAFDTGRLNRGQSAAVTLQGSGRIDYVCRFHRRMRGALVVSG